MVKTKAEIIGSVPETFLRIRQVSAITAIPISTIYELAARGDFPKQVRLTPRIVGWLASEVNSWMAARVAERDGQGGAHASA
jgi:prophage regulatory protein